jgi:putative transcriptional regulator
MESLIDFLCMQWGSIFGWMSDKIIRNRIEEKLREVHKSQKWLAEQLGVSENAISNWVNGKRDVSWDNLYEIADLLECDVRELIVPNDRSPYKHIKFMPGKM